MHGLALPASLLTRDNVIRSEQLECTQSYLEEYIHLGVLLSGHAEVFRHKMTQYVH